MKCPVLLAVLCLFVLPVHAVEIPPGGADLTGGGAVKGYAQPQHGKSAPVAGGGLAITITTPDSAKPFCAQFTQPLPGGAVAKGDLVLVVVKARALEGERGFVTAKLQLASAPYTSLAPDTGLDILSGGGEYPLVFQVTEPAAAGTASVTLLCGQQVQSLEVSSIRALRYPASFGADNLPRLRRSYPGREPDAPWRAEALARIERERKADLALRVTNAAGKPLANTAVRLTLRRHAFGFGSATPAKWYTEQSPDAERYRDVVDRLFSAIVYENDLKDFGWGPEVKPEDLAKKQAQLDRAFAWLAERRIAVRGHYLMQVAVPPNLGKMADDVPRVRAHVLGSAEQRLQWVGDRVTEWDVINHPIAWGGADLFSKRPGLERLDREVFDLARRLTKLPLLVNEDQVYRPGAQCDGTHAYIEALLRDGYPVAGLGNQAHFHESYLPSPQHILAVTDRFAKLVPKQIVTEYDVVTNADEALAADFTRDMLIACFSHPAYSGFLLWGFWENSHWKPEAASWNRDWTIRGRGEVLEEWIGRRWRTELTATTDSAGRITWRGFPGVYEVRRGETPPVLTDMIRAAGEAKEVKLP